MTLQDVTTRGLVLLGCGKMGSAMLEGWLARGVPSDKVWVIDPNPSDWVKSTGVHVNAALPRDPAIVLIAVKPQMMGAALTSLQALGAGPLYLTVAAGTTIATYEAALGAGIRLVRAMPNTPAAVGRGITAIIGNAHASPADLDLAEALLSAVGQVVRLDHEGQMDAVTAVSGSGPAYVFHLIEALAAAGESEGLPADLAMRLARATVTGAGELARLAPESAAQLRINVTSPGGTTAAALAVLMDPDSGFPPLLRRAVKAAADRGRELGK
ncbi:pyrroline-5-carboxylate reductase [Aliigemmobacter aestuarii]|uniref:Pyrroline-5-carboxylate reductase n=1 Tax=Aliigemmobacter aestuarii TaxID=1445661 RepID=A0A4S3MR74_9RHOB|nr:pyrroline-5-carboxylate reductase [Gemmobacter aestuarii]THD84927.1 pyrroline-5-carboxylate reductase [Gemmobacter aestuarii]